MADALGRVAFQKVDTLDDRIAGQHDLLALGRPEHGGIVAQAKRAGIRRKRREIAGDKLELVEALSPGAPDAVNHLRSSRRQTLAAALYARDDRECRSQPSAPPRRRTRGRYRHIRK